MRRALTGRQKQVLALVLEGQSNKEIAAVLGLAEITVKVYVSKLLRIFNVETRRHLIIRILQSKEEDNQR